MILTSEEKNNCENIRSNFLKNTSDEIRELSKCPKCSGTGLYAHFNKIDKTYSWDCISYCDYCNGVGFILNIKNILNDNGIYICENCNGRGCEKCNNTGFFNWIENILKRKSGYDQLPKFGD
jgi:DnaJ-class molecular chaperone